MFRELCFNSLEQVALMTNIKLTKMAINKLVKTSLENLINPLQAQE